MSTRRLPKRFIERAEREALRYGDDPWIFLRELVQNSRDAGAASIAFETPDAQTLLCHDDGSGMSRSDIELSLLRLYSSNKTNENAPDAGELIGRFGVGFWSVLRFKPRLIEVHTKTEEGASCALRIDLATESIQEVPSIRTSRGTTLRLWREHPRGAMARDVAKGIHKWAAFVRGIGQSPPPAISLNGGNKNETLAMPERFATELKTKNVEGYVGFGSRPRVRLYSRGLLVKETSTLESLFPKRQTTFRPAPGLFIDCSLNANHVDLLMNRSTVSENHALERALRDTENALERAQYQLLNSLGALPWTLRIWRFRRLLVGASFVMLLSLSIAVLGALVSREGWADSFKDTPTLPVFALPVMTQQTPRALREDVLQNIAPAIDPATDSGDNPWALAQDSDERLLLRYVVYDRFEQKRGFVAAASDRDPDYDFATKTTINVELSADGASAETYFPLPIPTHARYGAVAIVDGAEQLIEVDQDGQGRVKVPERVAQIQYAFDQHAPAARAPKTTLLNLPAALKSLAKKARALPKSKRRDFIWSTLKKRYRYSIDKEDALAFDNATGTFLERLEKTRAGDCDVINNALAATLVSAGIPARVAVGFVASDGQVQGPFHAWAEVYGEKTRTWEVVDLSTPVEQDTHVPTSALPTSAQSPLDAPVEHAPSEAAPSSPPNNHEEPDESSIGRLFTPFNALVLLVVLIAILLIGFGIIIIRRQGAGQTRPAGTHAVSLIASLLRERGRHDRHRIAHRRFFKRVDGTLVSLNSLEKMAQEHSLVLASPNDALLEDFKSRAQILDADDAITKALVGSLPGALHLDLLRTWIPADRPQNALSVVNRALKRVDSHIQLWLVPGQHVQEYSLNARDEGSLAQHHIAIGRDSALGQSIGRDRPLIVGQTLLAQTTFFRNHHEVVLGAIALELHSFVEGKNA